MKELKRLKREITASAPDLSDNIRNSVDWNAVSANSAKTVGSTQNTQADIRENKNTAHKNTAGKTTKKPFFKSFRFALIACGLILVIALPVVLSLTSKKPDKVKPVFASYDVVIDVNPNIVFNVGEGDVVVSQSGLNEDGVIFLYNKNYVGSKIDVATESVCAELKKLGLVTDGSIVRISAFDHKTKEIKDKTQSAIEKKMEEVLGGCVTMLYLSNEEIDRIEDYYESNSVKENEKKLIEEFCQKVIALAQEKISDINNVIESLKPYAKTDGLVELSGEVISQINAFNSKYKSNRYDPSKIRNVEDVEEFIEELEDEIEDLQDGIEDAGEEFSKGDYADLFEELCELVKENIFNSK